jgi:putative lipoprotein|nr:MAG TPA: foot protein [Caudoviricetes sp.]
MKKLIKLHFTVALVFLTGAVITEAYFNVAQTDATPQTTQYATDYNDNGISEQISAEAIAKAKAEWIEENGEWQPNLDADTEKYLRKTTALLQEQRNAKSKTR